MSAKSARAGGPGVTSLHHKPLQPLLTNKGLPTWAAASLFTQHSRFPRAGRTEAQNQWREAAQEHALQWMAEPLPRLGADRPSGAAGQRRLLCGRTCRKGAASSPPGFCSGSRTCTAFFAAGALSAGPRGQRVLCSGSALWALALPCLRRPRGPAIIATFLASTV